ncbi:A/G-specific adenine glycosylase muty, putative [Ixodes scapularis]|uniref:Adenine DNA glycosylase n=1 Tax=Ixodes scapularis TaxID=6945 RepID=B7P4H9_IXOSC|nr:A/G-specific adenine glycosylase muty, putative [Ixodes scapularis]|eukprot:XP_002406033.1 A/G-specific adenine glycosylase muty, putative [Ixodes scapularis]
MFDFGDARQLPWRDIAKADGDPNQKAYAVWVSEIMLQQTRVTTVIEYYKRWMKKWPTVVDLARASIEEVLQVWAGLGYYQRARRLHKGAQKVVRDLGGLFPNTPKHLAREIPGVGCYTAAAVASIAFGHRAGAVDGNVARVYSRMRLLGATLGSSPSERALWAAANEAVCPVRPGDFNQAVMELGARVCTLMSWDATQLYPHKAAKKEPRRETHAVSVLRSGDRYLLLRKTGQGRLLEGLWEFPNRQVDPQGSAKKSQDEERRVVLQIGAQLLNSAGGKKRARRLGEVTHLFSHIHATYCVYETTLDEECETEGSWMSAAEVESSGVSTAMKKVLSLAAGRAIET